MDIPKISFTQLFEEVVLGANIQLIPKKPANKKGVVIQVVKHINATTTQDSCHKICEVMLVGKTGSELMNDLNNEQTELLPFFEE